MPLTLRDPRALGQTYMCHTSTPCMPTVSVVVPTYNRGDVISRAIESVLQQTYQDYELIIVDDGSTDDTSEVVGNFDDPRIEYMYQQNQGANAARNKGIRHAKGEYISFLDSDDTLHPEHLEKIVNKFKMNDGFNSLCTGYRIIQEESIIDVSSVKRTISISDVNTGNNIGGFSCISVKACIFTKVGKLDEDLPACQDIDFYLRILQTEDMLGIGEYLVDYHLRDDQISSPQNIDKKIEAQMRIREKHEDVLKPEYFAEQHYARGLIYGNCRERQLAIREFKTAINYNRQNPVYYFHLIFVLLGIYPFRLSIFIKKYVKFIRRCVITLLELIDKIKITP